jgi:tetratricopeptide (TPR) repeat protein
MGRKVVFISYSHDSEEHRERVLALSERLRAGGLETVLDQYENGTPKQGWPRWMLDQLDIADCVLVVCTEAYYRRFRGHERPGSGRGVDWEGALITQELYDTGSRTMKFLPVLFAADQEPFIPEPLLSRRFYTLTSEASYEALYDALLDQAGVEPGDIGDLKAKARRKGSPLSFAHSADGDTPRIAPSRLTHVADELVGREAELARLDGAWDDPRINVITIVAWGGVGKTSLIAKWAADLAARGHDGADSFDWSFYSQGTREQGVASSDTFIAEALRFFGDPDLAESAASPWNKGSRLAQLVAQRRTLLILDGLEPLQYPPGPLAGQLKDPAVTALLKGLAARSLGLCVVTTRERVADLSAYRNSTAPEWELERLATPAGVLLLEKLGVSGRREEIERLVEDVDGHALTLNLLGTYLVRAHGGDVRRRHRVDLQKADRAIQGGHAFKAMAAYERWLGEGREEGVRQLAVLRLLGLFDRPAAAGCLAALRRPPAIPGLTEPLIDLAEEDWNLACSALAACGLVTLPAALSLHHLKGEQGKNPALDAHPLVREYFARRLREQLPAAWRAAHSRLYEHLRDTTEHQPDTLEGLQPLYQAVAHGCQAGRQQEACERVFGDRILRGTGEDGFYSTRKLGAFGADLSAVACFFESPWSRVSSALTEAAQAQLLNGAALNLRGLGRLNEALEPMRAGLEGAVRLEDWRSAAKSASNLSELELTLGEVSTAAKGAKRSVTFADCGGDAFQRMANRTAQADALHQAGLHAEAMELFREAERMQAERQPEYPLLYSLWGFRYCDLLLAEAERAAARGAGSVDAAEALSRVAREVEERATRVLVWEERMRGAPILDFALHHLTLIRARLYRAILEDAEPTPARSEIELAIDGFRRAGVPDYVLRGLLTRSWLRSLEGDTSGAQADLDEAQEIAERGPMPLYLADVHLYRARLFHEKDPLSAARALIEKHGYWRRKEELEDAEVAAKGWR